VLILAAVVVLARAPAVGTGRGRGDHLDAAALSPPH